MTTPKNWTPPPELPSELPPLPIGMNGRTAVFLGLAFEIKGQKRFNGYLLQKGGSDDHWSLDDNWESGDFEFYYAAESDSEICRLNQWGDFDPRKNAVEPAKPQTTLAAYLASAEAAIQEADTAFQAATECAAAWAKELQARRDIRDRLQGDNAFSRRAWFYAGMKCVRHHGKIPATFPALPD